MFIIKQSEANIVEIVEALKQGKVIVYPTETCYGLGCDATNSEAVKKLFAIKQRQENKSVLVLVSGIDMIKKYVQWTPTLEELARKYWPGPLTVVAKIIRQRLENKNINLPSGIVGKDDTIAFRVTDHIFAHDLVKQLGMPLVSTSANISAQTSPYDIESVLQMFDSAENKPDIIIDSGSLSYHSPSTIVRVADEKIEVLRQGELIVELME